MKPARRAAFAKAAQDAAIAAEAAHASRYQCQCPGCARHEGRCPVRHGDTEPAAPRPVGAYRRRAILHANQRDGQWAGICDQCPQQQGDQP